MLAKGASTTIKNRKGVSPLTMAQSCKTILELFNTKGYAKPANMQVKTKYSKSSLIEISKDKPYNRDADAYLAAQKARI